MTFYFFRPVHIIRLVSEGTVEGAIYSKAQSKWYLEKELTASVAAKSKLFLAVFDLYYMLLNEVFYWKAVILDGDEDSEETKNVELLLKEVLGLEK